MGGVAGTRAQGWRRYPGWSEPGSGEEPGAAAWFAQRALLRRRAQPRPRTIRRAVAGAISTGFDRRAIGQTAGIADPRVGAARPGTLPCISGRSRIIILIDARPVRALPAPGGAAARWASTHADGRRCALPPDPGRLYVWAEQRHASRHRKLPPKAAGESCGQTRSARLSRCCWSKPPTPTMSAW